MKMCRPHWPDGGRRSCWRVTGYGDGVSRSYSPTLHGIENIQNDRIIGTAQATVTQNLYTGGKTQANVNRSKNQVFAEHQPHRAEADQLNNTVSAM